MDFEQNRNNQFIHCLPYAFSHHKIITNNDGKPVDYIFLEINPAFSKMTGLSEKDIIGKKATEVYPWINNDRYDWIDFCGRVAITGDTLKNHQDISFLGRCYEVTVNSSGYGCFTVVSRDITDLKKAEQIIQEQQTRLDAIQEIAQVGFWELDLKTNYLTWSDEVYKIFGLKPQGVAPTYEEFLKAVHPEDRAAVDNAYNRSLKFGENTYEIEHRIVCKHTGELRYVHEKCKHLKDTSGPVIRSLGIVQDITSRKLAEKALKESEEKYRSVVSSITEGVVLQHHLDGVIAFNKSAEDIFKIEADEVMEKELMSSDWSMVYEDGTFFPPELHPSKHTLKTGEPCKNVVMGYRKNNKRTIWINVNTNPIFKDGHDKPYAAVISFSDITERKQIEEKVADYTRELEQLYRSLDREVYKAKRIHEKALPKSLPTLKNISFASYYQPAQKMGGDFYDAIVKGNKLIFYLSDVSGHGMDGAMLSLLVKHTIKSFISLSRENKITSGSIIKYLAEQFHQESYPEELFISIFLAVLDLETMDLSYCAAGFQDTPLVRLGDGRQLSLSSKGLFISQSLPVEMMDFAEKDIKLSPGSTLILYSDGLSEQQATPGSYYINRLPEVFYTNAHKKPSRVVKAVVEDFSRFNNGNAQGDDDITFLVLQVDPAGKESKKL